MTLNTRSIVLIIAALAIAGIAAFLARSWLSAERPGPAVAEQPAAVADNEILVAATNLPAGRILQKGDLNWQNWPMEDVPAEFVRKATGKEMDSMAGDVVRSGFQAGEPIARNRIIKKGDQGFMAAVITPGMRAMSIKVTPMTGVAGFVFPGDRVDLVMTHKLMDAESSKEIAKASETVLTNVRVLGIDQRADDQENTPTVAKTVTLEVTPRQAERVALAQEMGDLTVALRSVGNPNVTASDAELISAEPVEGSTYTLDSDVSQTLRKVGGGTSGGSVQVVRGSETSSVSFGR